MVEILSAVLSVVAFLGVACFIAAPLVLPRIPQGLTVGAFVARGRELLMRRVHRLAVHR